MPSGFGDAKLHSQIVKSYASSYLYQFTLQRVTSICGKSRGKAVDIISIKLIMNIFPSKTFTLQTTAPLAEVKQRLAKQTEEPKLVRWHFSYNHAHYQGTISDTGFEIRRIIHYRNSFLPNK